MHMHARTGVNEKALKAAGKAYHAVHIHPRSHASYYPGRSSSPPPLSLSPPLSRSLSLAHTRRDTLSHTLSHFLTHASSYLVGGGGRGVRKIERESNVETDAKSLSLIHFRRHAALHPTPFPVLPLPLPFLCPSVSLITNCHSLTRERAPPSLPPPPSVSVRAAHRCSSRCYSLQGMARSSAPRYAQEAPSGTHTPKRSPPKP